MSLLGLKDTEFAPLVRAVAGDHQHDEIEVRFARAVWTVIAGPGDGVAGELIAKLGPVAALEAVEAADIVDLLSDVDSGFSEKEIGDAAQGWRTKLRPGDVTAALSKAGRFGIQLIVPGDDSWPVGLDDLGVRAPFALWLRGNTSTLASASHSIALIGARAATGYGEHVAMEASAGLVDRGYTIVSGAAYGIDGIAHRAALASSGQTIAILAGGVDRFSPSGHEALLTRIVDEGAVVSELPCGAAPTLARFLQRNRLIAAMTQATVVLEAGYRSGALSTAGHAEALGRPLGAVPGPVTSAASAGCHRLIRDFGAICVTNADEMAELAPATQPVEGE